MPLPVRSLPVVQNWDCHSCTMCCREYIVHVSDEEKARIEAQGWSKEPGFAGVSLFGREGWFGRGRWHLEQRSRPFMGHITWLQPKT